MLTTCHFGEPVNSRTLTATTLAVAAAAGAGTVANLAQQPGWYARLRKPPYVPPDWVFPLAWTSLYTDIAATSAVAVDRLRTTGRQRALRRYIVALGVNLSLNAGWSWLFFKYRKLGLSALGAGVLTVSTADLARRTADVAPRAGYALLPYPLWCTFAFLLSVRIWLLNR
jgi:tryptophan-rich sensory protein